MTLAASWNKAGTRRWSAQKVEVLDVMDQTAVAKVTASWASTTCTLLDITFAENHQHRLAGASEEEGTIHPSMCRRPVRPILQ